MSGQPPKKGGSGISAVEQKARAERNSQKREEHKKSADIAGAIDAVANQLSANEDEQNANDKERRFREWLTIGLLFGTVIAAGWGDVIFYRTMMDSRDAERPAIWFTDDDPVVSWSPLENGSSLGRVVWTWRYENFGKTIAVNEQLLLNDVVLKGDLQQKPFGGPTGGDTIPIPPGKINFASALSAAIITEDRFIQLRHTDNGITFRAKIIYSDIYGGAHESDICQSHLASGGNEYCPGNEMK